MSIREVINPRCTFLARHILAERDRTAEVLGLQFLIDGFPEEHHDRAKELLTLRGFFYGLLPGAENYPGVWLYSPVPVFAVEPERGEPSNYHELSALLADLDVCGATHGVLLSAASGSGKTVAEIKAFCDCFWSSPGEQPKLAGFVPARLRPSGTPPQRDVVLEANLLQAAGLLNCGPETVRRWLASGPPLLIFCDLNAVPTDHRPDLVKALVEFQQDELKYRRGHRCVVAYRSTQLDDALIHQLRQDDAFRSYDLRQMPVQAAVEYVRNLREIEHWARDQCRLPELERNVEKECAKLREFATQYVRQGRSLISTPLLMHFVSILQEDDLQAIDSLAELYDRVVDRILKHNRKHYAGQMPQIIRQDSPGDAIINGMMTRVALAILREGPAATRLSASHLRGLLQYTEQPEGKESIRPSDDEGGSFWRASECIYFCNTPDLNLNSSLTAADVQGVIEFSLLRHDHGTTEMEHQIGFLHDSFLYYFASQALWRWKGPHRPAADTKQTDWQDAVAERVCRQPETWNLPNEFLSGRIDDEAKLALCERILLSESRWTRWSTAPRDRR